MKAILKTPQKRTAQMKKVIIKQYPELENLEVTPSVEEQIFKSVKYGFGEVTVKAVPSEELTIVPSANEQIREGLFDKVTVEAIPNSEVVSKDVDFIDYDGTLLYSYTLEEIENMTELPPLPTQPGLICQEWNWSLEDIKAFGRRLIVGATYITDDGKTRIYIELTSEDRLDMSLYFKQSVKNGVEVDWGDGSTIETFSHTSASQITHRYENVGNYVISLNPINNCIVTLGGNSSSYNIAGSTYISSARYYYANSITKINIGRNISSDWTYTFYYCTGLKEITLFNSMTKIGAYLFYGCHSLKNIVLPNGVKSINNNAFAQYCGLQKVSIPNGVTDIMSSAFYMSYSLQEIIIPDSVVNIENTAISTCYSLQELILPKNLKVVNSSFGSNNNVKKLIISNSVTNINGGFGYYYYVEELVIPNGVTNICNSAFNGWKSLKELIIPDSVISIGTSICSDCFSMTIIILSKNITNIPESAFNGCYSLLKIKIPSGVINIGSRAFAGCYSMKKYDFSEHTQIPTLANTNAFNTIPSDCKIIVPDALYDEWISATNWSNYADYIVKASEVA